MPCLLSRVKPYGNNPHSKSLLFLYLYANKNNRRGWSGMLAEKWGGRTLLPSPPWGAGRAQPSVGEDLFPTSSRGSSAPHRAFPEEHWVLRTLLLHPAWTGRSFILPRVCWETLLDSPKYRSSQVRLLWYSNRVCREDASFSSMLSL